MRIVKLTPDRYRRMPWKNGLGVTTEIARDPAEGERFDWRVSVATVAADGEFSRFEGCDRIIAALEGDGMILSHPETGASATLSALDPYSFSGDVATSCALRGAPFRDFNVITRRGRARGVLAVIARRSETRIDGRASIVIVYCVTGSATLDTSSESFTIDTDETLRIDGAAEGDALTLVTRDAQTVCVRVDLDEIG